MATVSDQVLNDAMAISVAEAVAAANSQAIASGVDIADYRVTVKQKDAEDGTALWRVNYSPIQSPGVFRRGGDFMVDVDAKNGSIYRTLLGQ